MSQRSTAQHCHIDTPFCTIRKSHVTWNFAVPGPHSEEIRRCILLFLCTLDRTQNSPKRRQEKQLSARRKNWNHNYYAGDWPTVTGCPVSNPGKVQMVYYHESSTRVGKPPGKVKGVSGEVLHFLKGTNSSFVCWSEERSPTSFCPLYFPTI